MDSDTQQRWGPVFRWRFNGPGHVVAPIALAFLAAGPRNPPVDGPRKGPPRPRKWLARLLLPLAFTLGLGIGTGAAWADAPELPQPGQGEDAARQLSISKADTHLPESQPEGKESDWRPQYLGMQFTSITQSLEAFHSPYSGPHSLTSRGDTEETDTYGIYLGARFTPLLQAYLDFEMARGNSPGKAVGLGSLSDGDVIRIGSVNLGEEPYLARGYLKYVVPLGTETVKQERGIGQIQMELAAERLEFKLGKFALTDDFDVNRYADSTRTQFATWSLWANTAWDYAADTRGYTNGLTAAWITPPFEARFAEVQVVTFANGNIFDEDLQHDHSENLEFTLRTGRWGAVLRTLAYENHARMGDYREAIDRAKASGTEPNITATEKPGRAKYGFGLNAEQPLAADGETGLFLRLGWNDGATEDFMFTEVDQLASLGLQLCGCHWGREADRIGIGTAVGGLSQAHRDYLAAGGLGFILGDGRLKYGDETVTEAYYRFQIGKHVQISPDFQYYVNPGYNRQRGPAQIIGLRIRAYDL